MVNLPDTHCNCCGMLCAPLEFHPYAACLMFKACADGNRVRANLAFVVEYGVNIAQNRKSEAERE